MPSHSPIDRWIGAKDPLIGFTSEEELIVPAAGVRTVSGDPVEFPVGLNITPTGSTVADTAANWIGSAGGVSLYNWNPRYLRNWHEVLADVAASGSGVRPKIAFGADSTSRGLNLATWDLAWPVVFADEMTRLTGIPFVTGGAAFGYPLGASNVATFDPRVTINAGWTSFTSTTLGGRFYLNSTTGNLLSFTPTVEIDTVDVYYYRSSTTGAFTADIDGATSGAGYSSVSAGGATGVVKLTLTATKGNHTVNIDRTSGGSEAVLIIGFDAYDSTASQVRVLQTACGSSRSGDWGTSTAASPGGGLLAVAPDLSFINLGINDWDNGIATATYKSNIQTLVTNARLSGDVIGIVPNPTGGTASAVTQETYREKIIELSNELSIPTIDLFTRCGSYSEMNSAGWMTDTLHPNLRHHYDVGRFVAHKLAGI